MAYTFGMAFLLRHNLQFQAYHLRIDSTGAAVVLFFLYNSGTMRSRTSCYISNER